MKEKLYKVRELFWPILEENNDADIPEETSILEMENPDNANIIKIEDENLDLALQLQCKIYQEEEDRRKGTESKAALFMGSLSVANTIVIGANTLIWG